MSKQALLVSAILAGVAVFCAVSLVRDLTSARALPSSPGPRQVAPSKSGDDPAVSGARGEALAAYNVIVAKHLFNPSRTEGGTAAGAPAAAPAPKPALLGVIVDGPKSRAYLEDPTSKRVLSYAIGDTVSGGRIEQITGDKVLIARPDGPVEVLLRDPSKPRSAPAASPGATTPPVPGPRMVPPLRPARPPVGEQVQPQAPRQ